MKRLSNRILKHHEWCRPYRKPIPHKVAVEELKRCGGTQFDPGLVEKFVKVIGNQKH